MAASAGKCVSHVMAAEQSQEALYRNTCELNINRFFSCLRSLEMGMEGLNMCSKFPHFVVRGFIVLMVTCISNTGCLTNYGIVLAAWQDAVMWLTEASQQRH
jgi:hypothetical protein